MELARNFPLLLDKVIGSSVESQGNHMLPSSHRVSRCTVSHMHAQVQKHKDTLGITSFHTIVVHGTSARPSLPLPLHMLSVGPTHSEWSGGWNSQHYFNCSFSLLFKLLVAQMNKGIKFM